MISRQNMLIQQIENDLGGEVSKDTVHRHNKYYVDYILRLIKIMAHKPCLNVYHKQAMN